ncbi:MAG: DUF983 domain-containing protein [Chitinophagaceae bacterium]|nr:MAG: DUF983 domain-containing protein [Chitinophagaceae bacterium]
MSENKPHRGYFASVLSCRCPRCREGKLFTNSTSIRVSKNLAMPKYCPACGQPTEIEVGFYYGTSYVSYAITVAMSVVTLVAWWFTIGLSINDNRFFYWIGSNAIFLILLQPWLMRVSRSLWISWFIGYDPLWKIKSPVDVSERMNQQQANNW